MNFKGPANFPDSGDLKIEGTPLFSRENSWGGWQTFTAGLSSLTVSIQPPSGGAARLRFYNGSAAKWFIENDAELSDLIFYRANDWSVPLRLNFADGSVHMGETSTKELTLTSSQGVLPSDVGSSQVLETVIGYMGNTAQRYVTLDRVRNGGDWFSSAWTESYDVDSYFAAHGGRRLWTRHDIGAASFSWGDGTICRMILDADHALTLGPTAGTGTGALYAGPGTFLSQANTGKSIIANASGNPGIQFISTDASSAERNWGIATSKIVYGGFSIRQSLVQGGDPYSSGRSALDFDASLNATFAGNVTSKGTGPNEFKGPMWATYFGITTPDNNLWYAYANNSEYAIAQNGVVKALSFAPTTGNATFAGSLAVNSSQIELGNATAGHFSIDNLGEYAALTAYNAIWGLKQLRINASNWSVTDTGNATFSGTGAFSGDVTAQNFHGSIGSEHIIDVNSEQDQIGHFVAMQSDCSYGASAYGPSSFAAAAHTHTIVNVTGLQTVLNGKTSNNGPNGATVIIGSDGHSYYWDGAAIQGLE